MVNKLIIDGEHVELTDKSQVPFTYTFAQAQTHQVYLGLDNTDEVCAYAFMDCKNLSYISFPPEIKRIKRGAFKNCTSLERVPIGENIEYIGKEAFDGCKSLSEIDFESTEVPDVYCTLPSQTVIFVPDGAKYEEIAYEKMNLDGNTEYFTKTQWNQYEKMFDVTFASATGGPYYQNKWDVIADNDHTLEYKNRYPITDIQFERNVRVPSGETFEFTYTILPENTTNPAITWFVSSDIFSFVELGKEGIIGVKATDNPAARGAQATISAYAESGIYNTATFMIPRS